MAISVIISAGPDAGSSSVYATGTIQHIITNAERTAFNIWDSSLKNAIATILGKAPNDVFVCSPTPWGDLYQTYGWPQVQTLLSVQSATVLGVTSSPTTLATTIFDNSAGKWPVEYLADLTQEVSVSAESSWSNTSAVEIGQSISYGISFLGSGVQGETFMSFSQTWEQGGSQDETVTIGTESGVSVTVQPGQKLEAELTASRGKLKVQLVYQLSLSGYTAMNYNPSYMGGHFWGLDINNAMWHGDIPTKITTTETIEIDYYANAKIVFKDVTTGQMVQSFAVAAKRGLAETI